MASEFAVALVPKISVFGHFGPWAQECGILAGGCCGVSRVSRIRFMVTVRVRDGCHEGWQHAPFELL